MPTVYEVEQALFRWAPQSLAADWDNVGLLVGDCKRQVQRVLVALDITEEVVREAAKGEYGLIVAHHPVIFPLAGPLLNVRDDDPRGRTLMLMVRNKIAGICMHTNLDAAQGGVNDMLARRLSLVEVEQLGDQGGIGRRGVLEESMSISAFLALVRKRLRPNGIRFVEGSRNVHRVAVGGGACGDFIPMALDRGCDTLVTSDVKYNQFMDAADLGLNLIDAGHYPTEDVVCPAILDYLSASFPDLEVAKSYSHREVIQYYV